MPSPVRAKLIATQGRYFEAQLMVNGTMFAVMDLFSLSPGAPKVGEEFDCALSATQFEHAEWEEIFAGNPQHRTGVEPLGAGRYRAFGKIVAIGGPVTVDCGLLRVENVVHSHDPALVGEYVAFTISRLDAALHK